jgi:hypothetical protein
VLDITTRVVFASVEVAGTVHRAIQLTRWVMTILIIDAIRDGPAMVHLVERAVGGAEVSKTTVSVVDARFQTHAPTIGVENTDASIIGLAGHAI